MKRRLVSLLLIMTMLTGCGSAADSSEASGEVIETEPETEVVEEIEDYNSNLNSYLEAYEYSEVETEIENEWALAYDDWLDTFSFPEDNFKMVMTFESEEYDTEGIYMTCASVGDSFCMETSNGANTMGLYTVGEDLYFSINVTEPNEYVTEESNGWYVYKDGASSFKGTEEEDTLDSITDSYTMDTDSVTSVEYAYETEENGVVYDVLNLVSISDDGESEEYEAYINRDEQTLYKLVGYDAEANTTGTFTFYDIDEIELPNTPDNAEELESEDGETMILGLVFAMIFIMVPAE